jgi:hypothetical protein
VTARASRAASDAGATVVTLPRTGAKPLRLRLTPIATGEARVGRMRAVVTVWDRLGAGLAVSASLWGLRGSGSVDHAFKIDSLDEIPGAVARLDLHDPETAPAPAKAKGPNHRARIDVVVERLCARVARLQARRAMADALGLAADRI